MRALIVDDSRTVRAVIGKYLRETGFDVFEAANGKEALRRFEEVDGFDLAMVDWNMPEMNGLQFVQAIRAEDEHKDMPIVMVTTETELEYVTEALTAGANEYVMKPFTKEILLAKLQMLEAIKF